MSFVTNVLPVRFALNINNRIVIARTYLINFGPSELDLISNLKCHSRMKLTSWSQLSPNLYCHTVRKQCAVQMHFHSFKYLELANSYRNHTF